MKLKKLLEKVRIAKRTFDAWIAKEIVSRPARGGECSPAVVVDAHVAAHLLGKGLSLETVRRMRAQAILWLESGPMFCILFDEALNSEGREWVLAYAKFQAGVALDKPQRIWVFWSEKKDQLQFIAGGHAYFQNKQREKILINKVCSGADPHLDNPGDVTDRPPRGWEKEEEVGRVEWKILRPKRKK